MGSVKFELFKGKKYNDGRHPIMLRITHGRKNKYFSTNISAFDNEWSKEKAQLTDIYKKQFKLNIVKFDELNLHLSNLFNEAKSVIIKLEDKGSNYSMNDITFFLNKKSKSTAFFSYTDKLIKDMMTSGKYGNASIYQTVLNNVKKFTKDKDFSIDKINYRWLCDFETFHLSKTANESNGNLINGLNTYMRTIRAIYNKAIKEELIEDGNNPFGRNRYQIQTAPVTKRAINKDAINLIRDLELPKNTPFWHTKQYFLFSFYCRGMNWSDIASLKLHNIADGRINYIRIKTKRKKAKSFSIKVTNQIQEIIDYYSVGKEKEDYIFPIIKRENEIEKRKDIKNGLKLFNDYFKRIGALCGIEKRLTSYIARYSWGNIAQKECGVNNGIISGGYGHSDPALLGVYLGDFDNEEIDSANDLITS